MNSSPKFSSPQTEVLLTTHNRLKKNNKKTWIELKS